MPDPDDFQEMIRRVFAGDASAAEDLVHRYEPEIRRVIRFRLRDPRLRRILDTADICQSVFARFFVRASLGQLDLDSPESLVGLLSVMATNRLIDQHRKQQTQERAAGRWPPTKSHSEPFDRQEPPHETAEYNELLAGVRQRLTADSRMISDLRRQGVSWADIGQQFGGRPDTIRKKFERECEQVFIQLGIPS